MYGTGFVSTMDEQRVRLYCYVWAWMNLDVWVMFDAVWGRNISHPHALFCCPNTLQWRWLFCCVDLRLLNVWNGCCVGAGRTARTYVLLRVCVIAFEGVIDVRCSMRSFYCHPHHVLFKYTTMAMTTLRWFSFIECMEQRMWCWP